MQDNIVQHTSHQIISYMGFNEGGKRKRKKEQSNVSV